MKIGILSDTHNDIVNIKKALDIFEKMNVEQLIHCGDVTNLEALQWFSQYPLILTFGNGDILTGEMGAYLKASNPDNHFGYQFVGEVGGKKIAATHGHLPEVNDDLMRRQGIDYFIHGHTHERTNRHQGDKMIINPGAVVRSAIIGSSICILDTSLDQLTFEWL